jgi:hypothetical protein
MCLATGLNSLAGHVCHIGDWVAGGDHCQSRSQTRNRIRDGDGDGEMEREGPVRWGEDDVKEKEVKVLGVDEIEY